MSSANSTGGRSVLDAWTRALKLTATIDQNPQRLLPDIVDEVALSRGAEPALLSEGQDLSYRELSERVNRHSRWALAQGIQKGDVVGLLMPNQPDYLAIWLGIIRIGGIVALFNDQMTEAGLAHCITVTAPAHIIVSSDLHVFAQGSRDRSGSASVIWAHGENGPNLQRIDTAIDHFSGEPLSSTERRGVDITDRALYIFTSGTTGLPKAANVSHRRVLIWSLWFAGLMDVSYTDRMYNCLPMHHSVGGVVATGSLLVRGGSVVLRKKFSARDFWDDVARSQCTLFQYIGELCRYLLNTPPVDAEKQHHLRICVGNGLRGDVWEPFRLRFNIPRIVEFYAASEGSFSLVNLEGKPGAIGRVPTFLSHRFPAEIVKYDSAKEQPERTDAGFCMRCAVNEIGEAIGRLDLDAGGVPRFEGYSSAEETERKILRDVFTKGDAWFRTGDLMRRDEANFFYFVDRIGDTFRWKGENVSTSQVAAVLDSCPGVRESTVYGVDIPGADGRGGMAVLVLDPTFDLGVLSSIIARDLPGYARPLFLRLQDRIETTATFKQQKRDLQSESFDPARCRDPLLVYDKHEARYRHLRREDFERICRGDFAF